MAPHLPSRLSVPCLAALLALVPLAAQAQQAGYGQTIDSPQQERELDYGTGSNSGAVLDATNPIELMNRLQRASAMDDATVPSDAIDAALKDFQTQQTPGGAAGSGLIQGP